jgi:hypothetical protein
VCVPEIISPYFSSSWTNSYFSHQAVFC